MPTLTIKTEPTYPVMIESGLLKNTEQWSELLEPLTGTWVIIADRSLYQLYAEPLLQLLKQHNDKVHLLSFDACEQNKSRQQKAALEDQLFELGCTRDTTLIALGGGVTTDLVGFIAATFCRGVPVIYCPTSLLAMVDASVGGKTGVNTPAGKNLIGSFYQPQAVLVDPRVLATLPRELFYDGMAEVIKHALLADPVLFEKLMEQVQTLLRLEPELLVEVITTSIAIKQHIVEQDATECKGPRKLLNLGHTIAHGLELVSQHQLSHGQAVAIGLALETQLAVKLGFCQQELLNKLKQILEIYHLPTAINFPIDQQALLSSLQLDKKNISDEIHFAFLADLGKPYIINEHYTHAVSTEVIRQVL